MLVLVLNDSLSVDELIDVVDVFSKFPPPVVVVGGGGAGACFLALNFGLTPIDDVETVLQNKTKIFFIFFKSNK